MRSFRVLQRSRARLGQDEAGVLERWDGLGERTLGLPQRLVHAEALLRLLASIGVLRSLHQHLVEVDLAALIFLCQRRLCVRQEALRWVALARNRCCCLHTRDICPLALAVRRGRLVTFLHRSIKTLIECPWLKATGTARISGSVPGLLPPEAAQVKLGLEVGLGYV